MLLRLAVFAGSAEKTIDYIQRLTDGESEFLEKEGFFDARELESTLKIARAEITASDTVSTPFRKYQILRYKYGFSVEESGGRDPEQILEDLGNELKPSEFYTLGTAINSNTVLLVEGLDIFSTQRRKDLVVEAILCGDFRFLSPFKSISGNGEMLEFPVVLESTVPSPKNKVKVAVSRLWDDEFIRKGGRIFEF